MIFGTLGKSAQFRNMFNVLKCCEMHTLHFLKSILKIEFIEKMLLHTGNALCVSFHYKVYKGPIRCCKAFVCLFLVINTKYTKHFTVTTSVVFIVKTRHFSTQNTSRLIYLRVITWVMVICKVFFLFSHFKCCEGDIQAELSN